MEDNAVSVDGDVFSEALELEFHEIDGGNAFELMVFNSDEEHCTSVSDELKVLVSCRHISLFDLTYNLEYTHVSLVPDLDDEPEVSEIEVDLDEDLSQILVSEEACMLNFGFEFSYKIQPKILHRILNPPPAVRVEEVVDGDVACMHVIVDNEEPDWRLAS